MLAMFSCIDNFSQLKMWFSNALLNGKFSSKIKAFSNLEELNNMVGMKNIKEAIFDKIILFLQN